MATTQVLQDGITFKKVKSSDNMKLSNSIVNTETDYSEPYIVPMINAVDINWNGAELLENTEINTSGKLLSEISIIEKILVKL